MIKVQEERERLLHAMLLALGAAALGLLGAMTLTVAIRDFVRAAHIGLRAITMIGGQTH